MEEGLVRQMDKLVSSNIACLGLGGRQPEADLDCCHDGQGACQKPFCPSHEMLLDGAGRGRRVEACMGIDLKRPDNSRVLCRKATILVAGREKNLAATARGIDARPGALSGLRPAAC